MASSTNMRHADDLREAVDWFDHQPMSWSSVEELKRRVLETADRLSAPTPIASARGRKQPVKA